MLPYYIAKLLTSPHFHRALHSQLHPGFTPEDGLKALENVFSVFDIDDWASLDLNLHFNFDPDLVLHNYRHVNYLRWFFEWDVRSLDDIARDEGLSDGNAVHRRARPAMKLLLSVLLPCLRTQLRTERYDLVLLQLNQVFKFPTWKI